MYSQHCGRALKLTRHKGETDRHHYSQTLGTQKNMHCLSPFTVVICRRFLGGFGKPTSQIRYMVAGAILIVLRVSERAREEAIPGPHEMNGPVSYPLLVLGATWKVVKVDASLPQCTSCYLARRGNTASADQQNLINKRTTYLIHKTFTSSSFCIYACHDYETVH